MPKFLDIVEWHENGTTARASALLRLHIKYETSSQVRFEIFANMPYPSKWVSPANVAGGLFEYLKNIGCTSANSYLPCVGDIFPAAANQRYSVVGIFATSNGGTEVLGALYISRTASQGDFVSRVINYPYYPLSLTGWSWELQEYRAGGMTTLRQYSV